MLKDIQKPKKAKREVKPKRTVKVVYPGDNTVAHTPCKDYRVSDTVRLYRVRKGPCSDNNTG